VDDAPEGLGTRIAAHQIRAAVDFELDGIEVQAVRSDEYGWNGYYTWPRIGYNAPLPRWFRDMLPEALQNLKDFNDLMHHQVGRDLWKKHGVDVILQFNPSRTSKEYLYHLDYLRQRDVIIDK
jgi:hypothetical protein